MPSCRRCADAAARGAEVCACAKAVNEMCANNERKAGGPTSDVKNRDRPAGDVRGHRSASPAPAAGRAGPGERKNLCRARNLSLAPRVCI